MTVTIANARIAVRTHGSMPIANPEMAQAPATTLNARTSARSAAATAVSSRYSATPAKYTVSAPRTRENIQRVTANRVSDCRHGDASGPAGAVGLMPASGLEEFLHVDLEPHRGVFGRADDATEGPDQDCDEDQAAQAGGGRPWT
jgi:hypothetical protein